MDMNDLTERQKMALTGKLSAKEWIKEGMGMLSVGIVSFDPLAEDDDPHAFRLTDKGRAIARALRHR